MRLPNMAVGRSRTVNLGFTFIKLNPFYSPMASTKDGRKYIRIPEHKRGGTTVPEHVRSTPQKPCPTKKK